MNLEYTVTAYQEQLAHKVIVTEHEFNIFSPPKLTVFTSPEKHFRMRVEFKVWHNRENGKAEYAMHKPGVSKQAFTITDFPIASKTITTLMPGVLDAVNHSAELKTKLFQADFLTTTTGEAVISLIYHKPLSESWQTQAQQLAQTLGCNIIGRSRKQKMVIGQDFVTEAFDVSGQRFHYQQVENSFTQPNATVCEQMLNWAVDCCKTLSGDLLELYCGNGNFTLPMSKHFNKVLATEISKTSVNSALHNISLNGCGNIEIARMSSEELTQALNKEREFRRLKDIDLDGYAFSTIFVDPPRAGLDEATEALASNFDNILYISCNPVTLKNNIQAFHSTHKITKFALFDQFPYTEHRECGVLLSRR